VCVEGKHKHTWIRQEKPPMKAIATAVLRLELTLVHLDFSVGNKTPDLNCLISGVLVHLDET
jgi:hypothetical protein